VSGQNPDSGGGAAAEKLQGLRRQLRLLRLQLPLIKDAVLYFLYFKKEVLRGPALGQAG
jgi:hypothetical protein